MLRAAWILLASAGLLVGQSDWPAYGNDPGGMKYSPLRQINQSNLGNLKRAWTYHTGETGRQFETTPVVAGGRMYLSTQSGRIVALTPETGALLWSYDPQARGAREHRGVAYWPGGKGTGARIVFTTGDARMIELDAATGRKIESFGNQGEVDLRVGVTEKFPKASYVFTSPPAIYGDLAIVGPSTPEGPGRGPSGDPRAFDVRTGKLVWRFHTVPQAGEPGNDTWGGDGWKDRSGPSLWGLMTVDTARGMVFLSTGNPADSFYGGDRKGTNLYANCVIALDAATGKLRWYHQLVHHDIFDYDAPGGPALIEAMRDGKPVPAVAQITKMGLLFVLDRMTGEPVFGEEERPVAKSEVPGEASWPTQPFPLKPAPLARTTITRDDLTRRTPEARQYCEKLFDQLQSGGLFTPYNLRKTLAYPGAMGGGNWGGVSFDPTLRYVFVNTSNLGTMGRLVANPEGSAVAYRNDNAYERFVDQDRYPCQQPPWGELSAVDAGTGEIAWRVPLGNFDELAAQGMKNTGTPNVGGSIVTGGGLVFIAATNDARLRAFDARTGKELWAAKLDATGNATPVTFQGRDGNQYVAIAAGGPAHLRNVGDMSVNSADTVIAFALGGKDTAPRPTSALAVKNTPAVSTEGGLPDGAGKAVVQRVCTKCHGVNAFLGMRMSREEWQHEVESMISRGAAANTRDQRTIVDYLTAHLGN